MDHHCRHLWQKITIVTICAKRSPLSPFVPKDHNRCQSCQKITIVAICAERLSQLRPLQSNGIILTIGRPWILNGSPLSPLIRHCGPMVILAVTLQFNGAIVAFEMVPLVIVGDHQCSPMAITNGANGDGMHHRCYLRHRHLFHLFVSVTIGANSKMSHSLWHFTRNLSVRTSVCT